MELCKYRYKYCTVMPYIEAIGEGIVGRNTNKQRFIAAETEEEINRAAQAAADWDLYLENKFTEFGIAADGNLNCIICAYIYLAENGLLPPDQSETPNHS